MPAPRNTWTRAKQVGKGALYVVALLVVALVGPTLREWLNLSETVFLWGALLLVYAGLQYAHDEQQFEIYCLRTEFDELKELHEDWLKRLGANIHDHRKATGHSAL